MNLGWSLRLYQAFGITVRVHWTLLLFLLYFLFRHARGPDAGLFWALGAWTALFVLVLLHEYGHCLAAHRMGGGSEEIMLWPLGGLAMTHHPMTARADLWVALGGPLVNVALIPVLGAACWLLHAPMIPGVLGFSTSMWDFSFFRDHPELLAWSFFVHGVATMNLVLLFFNAIPLFPLDGGRVFRNLLWRKIGLERATWWATGVGMALAAVLALYGVLGFALQERGGPEYGGILVISIALFAFFNCLTERQRLQHGLLADEQSSWLGRHPWQGDNWKGGAASGKLRTPSEGWWARRQRRRAALAAGRRRFEAERLRARINELLDRVAKEGLNGLPERERRELAEASKRLRELS